MVIKAIGVLCGVLLVIAIIGMGITLVKWAEYEQAQLDARRKRLEERRKRPF